MQGDVWRVAGLDENLDHVRWRRFASGLHQPLGLVVADGNDLRPGPRPDHPPARPQRRRRGRLLRVRQQRLRHLARRPRLHLRPGARSPQATSTRPPASRGLLRISADGKQRATSWPTGFRNPDGLGLSPDGTLTVPCSRGRMDARLDDLRAEPSTTAHRRHYGYGGRADGKPPTCRWSICRAGSTTRSGGQAVVPDDRWGPLQGPADPLLVRRRVRTSCCSATRSTASRKGRSSRSPATSSRASTAAGSTRATASSTSPAWPAGARTRPPTAASSASATRATPSSSRSPSTPTRTASWSSSHAARRSRSLAEAASRTRRHFAQAWNYRYGPGYGSPEFAPSHPGVIGHDPLDIAGSLLADGRTLFLELPDLQPVNQLHLHLKSTPAARTTSSPPSTARRALHAFPGYHPVAKTIAAHPITTDIALLGRTIPTPGKANRFPRSLRERLAGKVP